MLTGIKFENFRALRDVELKLEPLTVLVGPNASGKSSVFRALSPAGPSVRDIWQHDPGLKMRITASFSTGGKFIRAAAAWAPHVDVDAQLVRLDLNAMRQPMRSNPAKSLHSSGANLANVIDSLPRQTAIALAQQYCSLVPVYRDVDTPPVEDGNRTLRFVDRWKPDVTYFASDVSDGSLFALAMLTLQYQQPRPTILAIEEPERGLHPYLLQEVIRVLRVLTTGDSPIQVLLATQSAELLEYVEPHEVRFFTKDPTDGSVKVSSVDTTAAGWESAFEVYERSLRNAWLSGSLGGVPGGIHGNGTSGP